MRALLLSTCLGLLAVPALADAAPADVTPDVTPDAAAPTGRLPDAARPTAYRLDMTILPDQPRFAGRDEIDVEVKAPTAHLYLHGRDLHVTRAVATAGGKTMAATWTQVDKSGTARLDFATPLPAGKATLAFEFDGAFGDNPSGLYRVQVGDKWYSWTQFESTDARAAFPSFDEPGFKTPFTVSITTAPGTVAVSNAAPAAVTRVGALEKHSFEATRPLPTYLVAMVTGPFLHEKGAVPPGPERAQSLPLGVVAAQAQAGKLAYAMAESPRIVQLLEEYFGQPFPFPKLDQIASPVMPGAMENAGADIYADWLLMLDSGATVRQRQSFGMVVAHELSHQWFGDLVTPAWWDDIWLNESFANWMGYRIGNAWRPELNIGVGALAEGFGAMNIDALEVGRPIHQPIANTGEIDSAFDTITYGKGGQVIAMIAAYLGDEKFKAGVRLHLSRHMYGNATSAEFFGALADSAQDPRVLAAMQSFVDQPGVPVVDIRREGGALVASQSRYAFLGSKPAAQQWTIPICIRTAATRYCTLLDKPSAQLAAVPAGGWIMPNAGGAGYYRFNLSAADWQALIAAAPALPPGEALAFDDSLWAAFRAGKAEAAWLVAAAKSKANNPNSTASMEDGQRLAGLRLRGLIDPAAVPAYRKLMASIYGPKLTAIGFDPAAGAHKEDDPDRQKLRGDLVGLLASEAEDAGVRARLKAAGTAYVAGDRQALDQTFIGDALAVLVEDGGVPAAKALLDKAMASEDASFRSSALSAIGGSGREDVGRWMLALADSRVRASEQIDLIGSLATTAATRDMAGDWILANYERLAAGGNGIFLTSRLPQVLSYQCGVDRSQRIEAELGPKVRKAGAGVLDFERTVEAVRHCGDLKAAKGAEIAAAIQAG